MKSKELKPNFCIGEYKGIIGMMYRNKNEDALNVKEDTT